MTRIRHCSAFLAASIFLISGNLSYAQASPSEEPVQPVDESAKAHFKAAQSLYEAGSFQTAAKEFQEAYRLSNRPEILYNIYVAYRDAGEPEQAAAYLEQYLQKVPNAPDKPQLEAKLQSLKKLIAERNQAQQQASNNATTTASQESPAHDNKQGSFTSDVLPWLLIGVGGAALAAGTVTGLISLSKTSDIEDHCPDNICPSDYDLTAKRDSAQTFTTLSDVLLIGGAGLAITGAVLLLVLGDSDEDASTEKSLSASASCSMAFCGANLKGHF